MFPFFLFLFLFFIRNVDPPCWIQLCFAFVVLFREVCYFNYSLGFLVLSFGTHISLAQARLSLSLFFFLSLSHSSILSLCSTWFCFQHCFNSWFFLERPRLPSTSASLFTTFFSSLSTALYTKGKALSLSTPNHPCF